MCRSYIRTRVAKHIMFVCVHIRNERVCYIEIHLLGKLGLLAFSHPTPIQGVYIQQRLYSEHTLSTLITLPKFIYTQILNLFTFLFRDMCIKQQDVFPFLNFRFLYHPAHMSENKYKDILCSAILIFLCKSGQCDIIKNATQVVQFHL